MSQRKLVSKIAIILLIELIFGSFSSSSSPVLPSRIGHFRERQLMMGNPLRATEFGQLTEPNSYRNRRDLMEAAEMALKPNVGSRQLDIDNPAQHQEHQPKIPTKSPAGPSDDKIIAKLVSELREAIEKDQIPAEVSIKYPARMVESLNMLVDDIRWSLFEKVFRANHEVDEADLLTVRQIVEAEGGLDSFFK